MILGQAHRLTGAVGDGPPRWVGLSCTPLGVRLLTGKVRLSEPPKPVLACGCGRLGKRRRNRGSLNRDTTRPTPKLGVDKLGVKPQPRSQDADSRSSLSVHHRLIGLLELTSSPVEVFGMCSDYSIRKSRCVCPIGVRLLCSMIQTHRGVRSRS